MSGTEAYDMSRYCGQALEGWEFPENGLYECNDFKLYLEGKHKHVFIIKINNELAGFVFVNKLEAIPETDWNMGEFFIVAKFQRSGIGKTIAHHIFDRFKGEWSVGAIPQNTRALGFWRKVITEYTHNHFLEVLMTSEQLKTVARPDPYPMVMLRFKSPPWALPQNNQKKLSIRIFSQEDIVSAVEAFSEIGWFKPASLFEKYLKEQKIGKKFIWGAFVGDQFAGYVTLALHSSYISFAEKGIPEVKDLNVLPCYQRQGIGSSLLDRAEEKTKCYSALVGIGVGLYSDYGNAQKLYVYP